MRSTPWLRRALRAGLFLLLLLNLGCGGASKTQRQAKKPGFEALVVKVSDGDTFVAMQGDKRHVIRLSEVDTPEKRQARGQDAKRFTKDLVDHKTVRIVPLKTDPYGRTVAEIYLLDGRSLQEELLRAGWAWQFRRYSKDPALRALEQEARDARRGLWADDDPEPPWKWRRRQKRAKKGRARQGKRSRKGRRGWRKKKGTKKGGWSRKRKPRESEAPEATPTEPLSADAPVEAAPAGDAEQPGPEAGGHTDTEAEASEPVPEAEELGAH